MDARLVITGIALFFTGYAQATPLFSFFGVKVDILLSLAVLVALSPRSLYERAFLVIVGSAGFAIGAGIVPALVFFSSIFFTAYVVRRAVPWQPFLVGGALTLLFSFLVPVALGWDVALRLAPLTAREALYNLMAFAALYALMPPRYARYGRNQF